MQLDIRTSSVKSTKANGDGESRESWRLGSRELSFPFQNNQYTMRLKWNVTKIAYTVRLKHTSMRITSATFCRKF